MTPEQIYAVRCDLHERGFPADDWADDVIEDLPVWVERDILFDLIEAGMTIWTNGSLYVSKPLHGVTGFTVYRGDGFYRVEHDTLTEAVEHVENGHPCNRLAILHLLQESVK